MTRRGPHCGACGWWGETAYPWGRCRHKRREVAGTMPRTRESDGARCVEFQRPGEVCVSAPVAEEPPPDGRNMLRITGKLRMRECEGGFSAPEILIDDRRIDREVLEWLGVLPSHDRGGNCPDGSLGSFVLELRKVRT